MPQSAPMPGRRRVSVFVETPQGSFVKRDWVDGRLRLKYVSPVRCPFDYGHVVGEPAADGLGQDGIWLGPAARPLDVVEGLVTAVARFDDGGVVDDKWIVTPDGSFASSDADRIDRFFRMYAVVKRLLGKRSRYHGIVAADGAGRA